MSEQKQGADTRSMNEILASIRKIVTDEESNRESVAAERARIQAETDAEVFVLTGEMRADAAAPLTLGAEQRIARVEEAKPEAVDFSGDTGLSEEDIEDIVRRVVREELQGPIGQQISRKVKRLIREEVAKALAEEESLL